MYALNLNPARYHGKTIMVIGASTVQEPAVSIAKTLGLTVAAVDYNPEAPGMKWADYPLHISTKDIPACIKAARIHRIDGVMSCGSDQGARTAAAVASSLDLPGIPYEVAQNATNKISIHRLLAAHNIPAPRFFICQNRAEALKAMETLGLPLIVKPPDGHSSLGVSMVNEAEKLEEALEWAERFSSSGIWVLEEYIRAVRDGGTMEAFISNGEVKLIAKLSGKVTPAPYRGITSVCASSPDDTRELVQQIVNDAVFAMGINGGPVNVQIHLSAEGPRLIEIAPRLAGMYINSHLIPLSLGVNLIQANIDYSLGYAPDLTPKYQKAACQHFLVLTPGTVQEIPDLNQFACPELVELKLFVKPGGCIPEYYSASVAPGYCITVAETVEAAQNIASRLCQEVAGKILIK